MPDSPDQIMHRLEQENRSLKNILKQKDKKLEQKDKKLEQKDKKLEQKDKKLEQKDKTLKNILKQKDKKLEQKDRELGHAACGRAGTMAGTPARGQRCTC